MLNRFLLIPLCRKLLTFDKPNIKSFTKTGFHELLTINLSESLVLFNNEYYKQIDGVAMGSPLGPTFAKFGLKIALVNLNLSFIKDMLMTPCYFDQKIMYKNSEVTLITNILILSLHLR